MLKNRFLKFLGVGSVVIAASIFIGSCSNKITDEQLAQLRELRRQEKSLTESIQKDKDEKRRLESELNARKAELDKCAKEREFIMEKLSKWPNVWPSEMNEPEPAK